MNIHLNAVRWPRSAAVVGAYLLSALFLVGCGGGEDDTTGYVTPPSGEATPIVVNSPAQIAQESADNYDDNENGLITGATLKRWKDDWLNERPAGITGKLVIIQVTEGPGGTEYIAPDDKHVFTYLIDNSRWVETRSNGVIYTRSMVPAGATMDALLQEFDIDPHNDMIVIAMGTGGNFQAMVRGRAWYAFRYWGVKAENLAMLDGGNSWLNGNGLGAGDFAAAASSAPGTGVASVKTLADDNTALQATVQDMLRILPDSDTNVLDDGVFIWDARGTNQYSAGEDDGTGVPVADYMTTFQNNGARQGHPWGALQLNFTNMLLPAEGYRFRDKAELESYLNGETINGEAFIDATYQPVGVGNAYQDGDTIYTYCETTYRAMITGTASAAILGKPTRFYDGAMVEWSSLSYLLDWNGNYILPIDSPWRTDVVSFFRPADDPSKVEPRQIDDAYADNTNAIILADKAYKTGSSSSDDSSSGGGGALPPNPCGG
ncbi:sulfurtransferase [Thiohalobacter thiocyanaticus]|uniref:Sulfurtransferase n=1 Tax=Thiohalobacter thiocyanaticus TaxID=585455 RepID=A0A426QK38_9GAMM|nr:sulfurtransferase [Thiohalobacter thiocyanaticus]RRQ22132.1 sulfurtransferase [Thiohalobacter thiocyanaticus]